MGGIQPFRLTSTVHCVLAMHRPTVLVHHLHVGVADRHTAARDPVARAGHPRIAEQCLFLHLDRAALAQAAGTQAHRPRRARHRAAGHDESGLGPAVGGQERLPAEAIGPQQFVDDPEHGHVDSLGADDRRPPPGEVETLQVFGGDAQCQMAVPEGRTRRDRRCTGAQQPQVADRSA